MIGELSDIDKKVVHSETALYLEHLADIGYIKSFRWLADYYKKNSNISDYKKAKQLYFEGMLFDNDEHCRKEYARISIKVNDHFDSNPIQNAIRMIAFDTDEEKVNFNRTIIAKYILEGKIKEYKRDSAFAVLSNIGFLHDEITDYLLGECVLNGIGTEKNVIVAEYILENAVRDMEIKLKYWDYDRTIEKNSNMKKDEYYQIFQIAKSLLCQAREMKKCNGFEDVLDIDSERYLVLSDCEIQYKKINTSQPLFIKRA